MPNPGLQAPSDWNDPPPPSFLKAEVEDAPPLVVVASGVVPVALENQELLLLLLPAAASEPALLIAWLLVEPTPLLLPWLLAAVLLLPPILLPVTGLPPGLLRALPDSWPLLLLLPASSACGLGSHAHGATDESCPPAARLSTGEEGCEGWTEGGSDVPELILLDCGWPGLWWEGLGFWVLEEAERGTDQPKPSMRSEEAGMEGSWRPRMPCCCECCRREEGRPVEAVTAGTAVPSPVLKLSTSLLPLSLLLLLLLPLPLSVVLLLVVVELLSSLEVCEGRCTGAEPDRLRPAA